MIMVHDFVSRIVRIEENHLKVRKKIYGMEYGVTKFQNSKFLDLRSLTHMNILAESRRVAVDKKIL